MALIGCLLLTNLMGCRLLLVVPEGGMLTTQSGTIQCAATQSCPIDITDTMFDETFVAMPDTGYVFKGWRSQRWHLCGKAAGACTLTTNVFNTNSQLQAVLASDRVFYLSPQFVRGFESNLGIWQGEWLNDDATRQGPLSLEFAKIGKTKTHITVTLTHLMTASTGPHVIRLTADHRPNGKLSYRGDADVSGVRHKIVFSLEKTGRLSLRATPYDPPELPVFNAEGNMRGGVLFITYSLTQRVGGVSIHGNAKAYKN